MGAQPVDSTWWLRVVEDDTSVAQVLAVTCRITVGVASQVYVRHRIRPDQVENRMGSTEFVEASGIAWLIFLIIIWFEEIHHEIKKGKKGNYERTTDRTAEMLANE